MSEPSPSLAADRAEALLKPIIKYWTIELMREDPQIRRRLVTTLLKKNPTSTTRSVINVF
jgi:hypothetical protein